MTLARTLAAVFCVAGHGVWLAACGSPSAVPPTTEVYRVDIERTFTLLDPASAAAGIEREAAERANAQALALGSEANVGLDLRSDGFFKLRLSASEDATGVWEREGTALRLHTTALLGEPVGSETSTVDVLEEGLLRLATASGDVYLQRVP